MWKKIIRFIVITIMLMSISITSFAQEPIKENMKSLGTDIPINPFSVNLIKQNVSLSINKSNVATIGCRISGQTGVTKTSITAILQKKNKNSWNTVKKWSVTKNTTKISFCKTYKVQDRGTYRLKAIFKAYKGSKCETKTVYSAIKSS